MARCGARHHDHRYLSKGGHRHGEVGGKTVTINGIAKGSGMIAPDMATMLVFIFTDAASRHACCRRLLSASVGKIFNCITVDGDTSTSDTVLLFATGARQAPKGLKSPTIRGSRASPRRSTPSA